MVSVTGVAILGSEGTLSFLWRPNQATTVHAYAGVASRLDLPPLDRLEIHGYRLYLIPGQFLDDAVHHRRIAQGILNHQKLL